MNGSTLDDMLTETLTVRDLKEMLEDFDDDTPVLCSHCSGDYWQTEVANTIDNVSIKEVCYSAYHSMCKIGKDDDESQKVLILE